MAGVALEERFQELSSTVDMVHDIIDVISAGEEAASFERSLQLLETVHDKALKGKQEYTDIYESLCQHSCLLCVVTDSIVITRAEMP